MVSNHNEEMSTINSTNVSHFYLNFSYFCDFFLGHREFVRLQQVIRFVKKGASLSCNTLAHRHLLPFLGPWSMPQGPPVRGPPLLTLFCGSGLLP
jgi:hypothetical protein